MTTGCVRYQALTLPIRALATLLVAAAMMGASPSFAGKLTCLTGTDPSVANDVAQIAALRAVVEAACPCADYDGSSGKTHGSYTACTRASINSEVGVEHLRSQCRATVKKYYGTSTCGVPASRGVLPCVKLTAAGTLSCRVKSAALCAGTGQAACLGFTTCIDATDTNHDGLIGAGDCGVCASNQAGPMVTPTIPLGPTAPSNTPATGLCGNGIVDPGEQCDGQPFCGSNCQLATIAFTACCEFNFSQIPPASMCGNPGFTDSALYHTCVVAGGQPSRGRACTPSAPGPCPPVTPPPGLETLTLGTCQGSTFPATLVCCQQFLQPAQGPASCQEQVVSSTEELSAFVWSCAITFGTSSVPIVGSCDALGACGP